MDELKAITECIDREASDLTRAEYLVLLELLEDEIAVRIEGVHMDMEQAVNDE